MSDPIPTHAYMRGRGRVYVQSIDYESGPNSTALVRFDSGEGVRGPAFTVAFSDLDYEKRTGLDSGQSVIGKRVEWPEGMLNPGEYAKHAEGFWIAMSPTGHACNLRAHDITEHDDGTITVSPSIGIYQGNMDVFVYHGHLERGVWREC